MSADDDAPVEIVGYDQAWPFRFQEERERLHDTLGAWLAGPVEHIGSTAIPGVPAKPVIDIMAAVETLEASRPAIAAASTLGYCYAPYRSDTEHWFCKPSPTLRTHHLHLVPFGSPEWTAALAFRDYLRADPASASEYARLKQRLALEHRFDREAYTQAKTPFIARIVSLSRRNVRRESP